MPMSGRDYSLRPRRTRSKLVPVVLSATAISSGSLAAVLALLPAEETTTLEVAPPRVGDLSPVPVAGALTTPATPRDNSPIEALVEEALTTEVAANWLEMTVASGDTLSGLFDRYGLAAADWMALSKTAGAGEALTRIRPGDRLRIDRDASGRVTRLEYPLDQLTTLTVERGDEGQFVAETLTVDVEERIAYATGEIHSSLFATANAAGLSDKLTMELANIFGWDIDFALDIRRGDQFAVVYQQRFLEGEKIADGDILAAEFVNQGRLIRAVRFETPEGDADYYTPSGDSMRKAFIRTPVDFARISSGFNLNRKHPILNTIRAPSRCGLRSPERYADQVHGRWQSDLCRNQGRLWTHGHRSARASVHNALRSHEQLPQGHPDRGTRPSGPDHRLCGQQRPGNRATPAL